MVKQGSSDGAEENWETTSENSDEDSRGKSRRGGGRGNKNAGPVSRPQQFPAASKAPGAEKKNGLAVCHYRVIRSIRVHTHKVIYKMISHFCG
jgi:hypothetical protein